MSARPIPKQAWVHLHPDVGIPREAQPRIFDRFYHTDRSEDNVFGGLGIGLAIARQVINQHHGSVTVESAPGHGSTFTITLPKWGKHKIS